MAITYLFNGEMMKMGTDEFTSVEPGQTHWQYAEDPSVISAREPIQETADRVLRSLHIPDEDLSYDTKLVIPWTDQDRRAMRMLYGKVDILDLSLFLKRSKTAVWTMATRMGLRADRNMPWSSVELSRAVKLRGEGVTYREIGRMLGRSKSSVQNALDRHEA